MEVRKVRCQDCGHEWESRAESPRCSKADCGRSRKVEPVEQGDDQEETETETTNTTEVSSSDENSGSTSSDQDRSPAETRRESGSESTEVSDPTGETEPETAPDFSFNSNTVEEPEETEEETPEKPSERDPDEKGETTADDAEGEDEELPEVEVEQIAPAIEQTFNVVAMQRGDHWKMQGEPVEMGTGVEVAKESAMLANAWTPVINIYAPYMVQNHMALILAASTTMSVLGPKVKKDAEIRRREAEAEETAEDESIERRTTDAFDVEETEEEEEQTVASTSSIEENPSLSELT